MSLKWTNIVEANAEIERLTKSLEEANARISSFTDMEKELRKANENIAGQFDGFQSKIVDLEGKLSAATAKVSSFDVEVEKKASAKALEIVAAQGAKPIPSNPQTDAFKEITEQFMAEKDPMKRAALWEQHRDELTKALMGRK